MRRGCTIVPTTNVCSIPTVRLTIIFHSNLAPDIELAIWIRGGSGEILPQVNIRYGGIGCMASYMRHVH